MSTSTVHNDDGVRRSGLWGPHNATVPAAVAGTGAP